MTEENSQKTLHMEIESGGLESVDKEIITVCGDDMEECFEYFKKLKDSYEE